MKRKQPISVETAAAQDEINMRESLRQAFRLTRTKARAGQLDSEALVDIFSDMAINKRWTICTEDKDDALAFAAFLALNITLLQNDSNHWSPSRRERAPMILKIVNEWLAPERPHYVLPSVNSFARALFGDVWGDLVLADRVQDWEIHKLITGNRPAFQAHMVLYKPDFAESLPALEAP